MDKSQYFGATESFDPAFNLDAFDHLYSGNLIITKRLTNKLIDKLIEHKDKIILHCTVTGMGGSKIEPFVPTYEEYYEKCKELISKGFPVNQIVLRVDPVVPTEKGIDTAIKVIDKFHDLGIKRVRWSSVDMYPHVKERFEKAGIKIPYNTFNAPADMIKHAHTILEDRCKSYGITLESCGEGLFQGTPCLSQKDVDILGLTDTITLEGNAGQRKTCGCPKNKKQLPLGEKPHQCKHGCLYCYWKDE